MQSSDKFQVDEFHCLTDILAGRIAAIHPVTTVDGLLNNILSSKQISTNFDIYHDMVNQLLDSGG